MSTIQQGKSPIHDDENINLSHIDDEGAFLGISPKWIRRFMDLALVYRSWSKDPSTQVGAVISRGNDELSKGFNGFPAAIEDKDEWLQDRDVKLPWVDHAEANAIFRCWGRDMTDTVIIVTSPPCRECSKLINLANISGVIYLDGTDDYNSRWEKDTEIMLDYFKRVGIEVRCIRRNMNG